MREFARVHQPVHGGRTDTERLGHPPDTHQPLARLSREAAKPPVAAVH
jgi:hypothetical protein